MEVKSGEGSAILFEVFFLLAQEVDNHVELTDISSWSALTPCRFKAAC
jgi:hypothetical protein